MQFTLRILKHVSRGTSTIRAFLFLFVLIALSFILIIKAINIFLPFTYLAF